MAGKVGPHTQPVFPEGGSADDLALARQAVDVGYDDPTLLSVGFSRLEIDAGINPSDPRLEYADLLVQRSLSDTQASRLWNTEDTQPIIRQDTLKAEVIRLYGDLTLSTENINLNPASPDAIRQARIAIARQDALNAAGPLSPEAIDRRKHDDLAKQLAARLPGFTTRQLEWLAYAFDNVDRAVNTHSGNETTNYA